MSSLTKVLNTISDIETLSVRVVPTDFYYVLKIKMLSGAMNGEQPTNISKYILTLVNVEHPSHIVYISPFKDEMWILFSSVSQSQQHNFKGNHQELCSYFASVLTQQTGLLCKCWLIELNSRIKVIEYFHSIVFLNMFKRVGDNHITIEDAIDAFPREEWNNLPATDKYGLFVKYDQFKTMSEEIDYSQLEKYKTYFFS